MAGWISEKGTSRNWPLGICAALGIISVTLLIYQPHTSLIEIYILTFLFGVGTSGQALSFCVVSDITPTPLIGSAMGFNNLLIVASGAIFQPLVGGIMHHVWDGKMLHGIPDYSIGDYQTAFIILPLCYLVGTLICLVWLKETHCKPYDIA